MNTINNNPRFELSKFPNYMLKGEELEDFQFTNRDLRLCEILEDIIEVIA